MGISHQARLHELESKSSTLGTGGSLIFNFAGLPVNTRCIGMMLLADFDVTTAGADGARPVNVAAKLYDLLEHDSDFFRLRATGTMLSRLYHHMHGRTLSNALGGNAISRYRVPTWIPLSDPRAVEPYDTAIPTELLEGKTLEVKVSNVTAVQLFGTSAVATVNHRLFLFLTDGVGAIDPSYTIINFEDWGGQTVRLAQGGVFSHVNIFKEPVSFADPATITPDTEITRVNFTHAGQDIIKSSLTTAMVIGFNHITGTGGFEDNSSEQLSDTAVPFLPVFTPATQYKLPSLPGGEGQTVLSLTGSLTSVRVGYRMIGMKKAAQVEQAARILIPEAGKVTRSLRTSDKGAIGGNSSAPDDVARRRRASLLIPGRLEG